MSLECELQVMDGTDSPSSKFIFPVTRHASADDMVLRASNMLWEALQQLAGSLKISQHLIRDLHTYYELRLGVYIAHSTIHRIIFEV